MSNREGSSDLRNLHQSNPLSEHRESKQSRSRDLNKSKNSFGTRNKTDMFEDDVEYVQKPQHPQPALRSEPEPQEALRKPGAGLQTQGILTYSLFARDKANRKSALALEADKGQKTQLCASPQSGFEPKSDPSDSFGKAPMTPLAAGEYKGPMDLEQVSGIGIEEYTSDSSDSYYKPPDAVYWLFDDQPQYRETLYDPVVPMKKAEVSVYNKRFSKGKWLSFHLLEAQNRSYFAEANSSDDSLLFQPTRSRTKHTTDPESEALTSEHTDRRSELEAPLAEPPPSSDRQAPRPAFLPKTEKNLSLLPPRTSPVLEAAPRDAAPAETKQPAPRPAQPATQPQAPIPAEQKPPRLPQTAPIAQMPKPAPRDPTEFNPPPKPQEKPAPEKPPQKPARLQIVVEGEEESNSLGLFTTRSEKKRQKNKLRKEKKNKRKTEAPIEEVAEEERRSRGPSQEEEEEGGLVREELRSIRNDSPESEAEARPPQTTQEPAPATGDSSRSPRSGSPAGRAQAPQTKAPPAQAPQAPEPAPKLRPGQAPVFKEDLEAAREAPARRLPDRQPQQGEEEQEALQPAKKKRKKKKNRNKNQVPAPRAQEPSEPGTPQSEVSFASGSCKPIPQQSLSGSLERSRSGARSSDRAGRLPEEVREMLTFLHSNSEKSLEPISEVVYLLTLVDDLIGPGSHHSAYHIELNRETKSLKIAK